MTKPITLFEGFQVDLFLIIIIVIAVAGIGVAFIPGAPVNLTPALVAMNLILIIFYYNQWRNTTRPILSTSVFGFNHNSGMIIGDDIPKPSVLEGCHYGVFFHLSNISDNTASKITIEFSFTSMNLCISEKKYLSYLNPHETARILLPLKKFIETHSDHFTTITQGDISYTVPKDTLFFDMVVKVTYGSIPRYSTKDTYFMEWVGVNRTPMPPFQIRSWNLRNDLVITKEDGVR